LTATLHLPAPVGRAEAPFLGLGPRQRRRVGGRDWTSAGRARSRPWERARRDQCAGYARRFARGCTFGRGFDSRRLH